MTLLKTTALLCLFATVAVANDGQAIQEYQAPELDLFGDSDQATGSDAVFLGFEIEVLERRLATLEEENERLKVRLKALEVLMGIEGQ